MSLRADLLATAAPITDAERNGTFQIVLDSRGEFALVRWCGEFANWAFSSGAVLDFEPTHYIPRGSDG